MLRRLACRTAGRLPGNGVVSAATPSALLFTFPLLLIALALIGLGITSANGLEVAIGAICLVAALSKPQGAAQH
jgi:hypothetical protein